MITDASALKKRPWQTEFLEGVGSRVPAGAAFFFQRELLSDLEAVDDEVDVGQQPVFDANTKLNLHGPHRLPPRAAVDGGRDERSREGGVPSQGAHGHQQEHLRVEGVVVERRSASTALHRALS